MDLLAENISKRRGRQWVIRHFSQVFHPDQIYGVAGSNGSGKSTLLQLLSSFLEPSEGHCLLLDQGEKKSAEDRVGFFSVAAPYLPLIPHFTIREWMQFHAKCKGWSHDVTTERVIELTGLAQHGDKPIHALSSGMKQRIQLLTALASDAAFVFLDEPTSNLDDRSKQWFVDQLDMFKSGKGVIIASNESFDLAVCEQIIQVQNYK